MAKNEFENLSFEEAMQELESIVRSLEEGQVKLDDAVSAYEKGAKLQAHCQQKLNDAQLKLQKISNKDGKIEVQAIDASYS